MAQFGHWTDMLRGLPSMLGMTGEPREVANMPGLEATSPKAPPDRIILRLDLAEVKDFTALAAMQQSRRIDGGRQRRHYACRLLHRWPLRTGYENIIADVAAIASRLPAPPELVLDATGAGRAVPQMFRKAKLPIKRFVPVVITGGTKVTQEADGTWHVAKRELVSSVQSALQSGRLKIARQLREAKTLIRELQAFRVKINVATHNESFEAWRERDHDDLVLAAALCVVWGE